eukprot:g8488.t1
MWSGLGAETGHEEGVRATTGASRQGPTRPRPPRHQKSVDLCVLSGSSSDESSTTEEEGISIRGFSLRHIPTFVGSTTGDDEKWEEGHTKHVRRTGDDATQRPAKPLKPPTPQDGGSTSNPSPQSAVTVVAGGSEGRDSRAATQDQAATPLQNWVDHAGWELAGEGTGTTRERQALRAEQRRRQERIREEAAVAAAAEVAAAGGDVNAVAAAAVAAAAAAEARGGFKRPGARGRRQQQQQQQARPSRQRGKLRVKGTHGGGGGGRGSGGDGGDDGDVEDGGTMAGGDEQRPRLTTDDFKTPVRRPASPDNLKGLLAAATPTPAATRSAAGQDGDCQLCVPGGGTKSGGLMSKLEAAAGTRACGGKPAEMLAQTGEMDYRPREARAQARGFDPLGESQQLAGGDGGDELKEEEQQFPSSSSFNYSTSSTSSKGRGRAGGGGGWLMQSGSDTLDHSLGSNSLLASTTDEEVRRAESLAGVIGHHPELEGSHRELADSFRAASLRDTASTLRATSLRDTGSSTGSSVGTRRNSSERRRRRGLLGGLKKGMGVVWEKIASDHPEPLPIDKSLTKEEQRAKHLQMEIRRRNDWQTNSMAEQHVLTSVMMQQQEKVMK